MFNDSIYSRTLLFSERLGQINARSHSEYLETEEKKKVTARYGSRIQTSKEPRFPGEYNDDLLAGNWNEISGGAYGCVFNVAVTTGDRFGGGNRIALKLEILQTSDETLEKNDNEIYSSYSASKTLTDYPKSDPFAQIVFGFGRIELTKRDGGATLAFVDSVIGALINTPRCKDFANNLREAKRDIENGDTRLLQYIESDLATEGSLHGSAVFSGMEAIRGATFQLFYSTACNDSLYGIVHNDLKPHNLLVFENTEKESYRITVTGSDGHITRLFLPKPRYLVKITDFGAAFSDLYPASDLGLEYDYYMGTIQYAPPEEGLYRRLYPNIYLEDQRTNIPKKTVASDVWALGMTLIAMAISPWDMKAEGFVTSVVNKTGTVFQAKEVLDLAMSLTSIGNFVTNMNKKLEKKFKITSKPFDKERRIAFVSICLLQNAIGNGFLPKEGKGDNPFGQFYEYVKNHEDEAVKASKKWTSPPSEKPVFTRVREKIEEKIGEDGLDFVRRCLAWKASDRDLFAKIRPPGTGLSWNNHPFLREYAVGSSFDFSRSESHSIRDFFLFLSE